MPMSIQNSHYRIGACNEQSARISSILFTPIQYSVCLQLRTESVAMLERCQKGFGLNSGGAVIRLVLDELLCTENHTIKRQ